jgi:tRNA dimethylallyltransferase
MARLPVVLLMGPTASGKTGLAMELAARLDARGTPVEIVTVDSAQVYRGMDIGTAKPDFEMRAQVPHHLIDVCDPAEPYSAARFAVDAKRIVAEIQSRGHLPLLVGGSMLYFRAYTGGLSDLPSADPALRARLAARAHQEGWPVLHAQLAQLDPVTATRLHPNDGHRIQRALEVVLSSGRPLSEQRAGTLPSDRTFDGVKLALMPPDRARLHERIATRLQQMLAQGFADEVRALHVRGDLHPGLPSIRSVGYRQLWSWMDGDCDLTQASQKALEATRQFAKRQITWLRSEHDPCWLNSEAPDAVDLALRRIDEWKQRSPC